MAKIIDSQLRDWAALLKLPEIQDPDLLATYQQKRLDKTELACINLLALFPYPVTKEVLMTVLEKVADKAQRPRGQRQDGLNKIFSDLLENGQPNVFKLEKTLQQLEKTGFLARADINDNNNKVATVALFQPIAAHYSTPLKNLYFDDWISYQQHLAQLNAEWARSEGNNTIQRLWFNCKRLLHSLSTTHKQQAMNKIYRPEISPLLTNLCCSYSMACRLKLHLLSGFFQRLWDKPDFCMNPEAKAFLQAEAGQALYRLGEKETALTLMERAYPVLLNERSWQAAGDVAYLLGQHTFTLDQSKSIELTRESVALAEKHRDTKTVLHRLRSLFDLYKGNGDIKEAVAIADKAKRLAQEIRSPQWAPG